MTKDQLVAEISQSRFAIARDCAALRTELNFAAKLHRSVRRKPLAWLSGATVLGWLIAGRKTKTRVITKTERPDQKTEWKKSAGLWSFCFALLKFAAPLLKPVFSVYAGKRLAEIADRFAKRME